MTVLNKVFETIRVENSNFRNNILTQKRLNYQLRKTNLLNFPEVTVYK